VDTAAMGAAGRKITRSSDPEDPPMHEAQSTGYAYGLWPLVLVNIGLFVGFLVSFAKPRSTIEWRSLGVFSAFIVALFVEMYGFPLTIYLLSSWLGNRYPVADPFSHTNGHLLGVFFGIRSDHGTLLHLLSNVLIIGGAVLIAQGWSAIHGGQGQLVTTGPYAYVRHPQHLGFIVVILGFLIQWPTLVTLVMAPILILRYIRLARQEEAEVQRQFPQEYQAYRSRVPAWIPTWR
jgi:protein-S-isoprenylcysteine O-methyltransferase Ste14